jgi:hypothetical protein
VLSHVGGGANLGCKRDFVSAVARGLGANMTPDVRADFLDALGRLVRCAVR